MATDEAIAARYKAAMDCSSCFGSMGALSRASVDLPQPRWVGPRYESSHPRVLIVLINPGAGNGRQTPENVDLKRLLHRYKTNEASLEGVFAFQKGHMRAWGRGGKFLPFYTTALNLQLDELSFLNIALCATANDKYPARMLMNCFQSHTAEIAKVLQPDVVLLSGATTHAFTRDFSRVLPRAKVICMMHYANREGGEAENREHERVRQVLHDHQCSRGF
ncbi:MAG: hypothetical protein WCJ87_08105 [Burkholderiales bacterium]